MTQTTGGSHTTGSHAAGASLPAEHDDRGQASVGELISKVGEDFSTLVRQEVALAKAELKESAAKAGKGAGMLGGAGVAGHFVLLFLSIALWWGIGNATGWAWSALIVAAVWAVIAAILAAVGRKELKQVEGLPKTTDTAKQIPNAVKGHEERNR